MVEPISLGPWSEIETLELIRIHPITSGGGLPEALGKIFYTNTELAATDSYSNKFCIWFLTVLGQSMEHTRLQLISLIVPYVSLSASLEPQELVKVAVCWDYPSF